MAVWIHRTTFNRLGSTSSASLPEPQANYVQNPDESAIFGHPNRYWILTGDIFTLMDATAQAVVDAALLVTQRDDLADEIEELESYSRAFALIVMDEINILRAQHGLADRTPAQLKNALRNRLDT